MIIPTFLTNLALGIITANVAAIMALSSWVTGSQIIQGNVFFDTTSNLNPAIYLNTTEVLGFTGSKLTLAGDIDFAAANTPVCLEQGGVPFYCLQQEVLTASGFAIGIGSGSAMRASFQSPYSTSGAIVRIKVECGAIPTTVYMDVGTSTAPHGSGTNVVSNWALSASGVYLRVPDSGSGQYLVGAVLTALDVRPGEIAYDDTTWFHAVTTSGSTSTLDTDCNLKVWSHARYGTY